MRSRGEATLGPPPAPLHCALTPDSYSLRVLDRQFFGHVSCPQFSYSDRPVIKTDEHGWYLYYPFSVLRYNIA